MVSAARTTPVGAGWGKRGEAPTPESRPNKPCFQPLSSTGVEVDELVALAGELGIEVRAVVGA
jgi:hypothetical protein